MVQQAIKDSWFHVRVNSDSVGDMDNPWDWCNEHYRTLSWTFDLDPKLLYAVDYYFQNQEDAVRFQLTWG